MKDNRFRVWICEALMSDGIWYPMPYWGSSNTRKDCAKLVRKYLGENGIWIRKNGRFTNRIRFREFMKLRKSK